MNISRYHHVAILCGFLAFFAPSMAFASDAGAPIANAPTAVGGAVFSGYLTDANTHVRLNVAVGNDVANIGGLVRTYVSVNGGADVEIGSPHTILAGEIGTKFDVPDIAVSDILTAISQASLPDGSQFTFKKRVYEADNDPLSLVALGTLTTVVLGSHPAPSIDNVYVGSTLTDAHSYTFSTASPSFDLVLSGDDYLSTLTCALDGKPAEDCISYSYATSTLADGSHSLVVTAKDAFNQSSTDTVSFCINTCADVVAPVIAAHTDVSQTTTNSSGATVTYTTPTVTDNVDASVTVTCLPASGTNFAVGDTTVSCNAQDAALNAATTVSFVVHVTLNAPSPNTPAGNGPPIPNASAPIIAPVQEPPSSAPAIVTEAVVTNEGAPVDTPAVAAPPKVAVKSAAPREKTPAPVAKITAPTVQAETQTASAADAGGLNYLWILMGLLGLTLLGLFVWNTYWTATK